MVSCIVLMVCVLNPSPVAVSSYEGSTVYEELCSLPLNERKEKYRELDDITKGAVWVCHLERFLQKGEISVKAEECVFYLINMLESVDVFSGRNNTLYELRILNPIQSVYESLKEELGQQVAYNLLSILGDPAPSYENSLKFTKKCNCNTDTDFCWPTTCRSKSCTFSSSGCGVLWLYGCNGICS